MGTPIGPGIQASRIRSRRGAPAWLSAHLHFRGPLRSPICDRIVREVVAAFLPGGDEATRLSAAFFIRYSSDGPHVRLRVRPRRAADGDAVRSSIERRWAALVASGRGAEACEPGVRWTSYVAETERYGGVHALPIAERHFSDSSDFVVRQLTPVVCGDVTLRLGRAMLSMMTIWHVFLESPTLVRAAAAAYSRDYLSLLVPESTLRDAVMGRFAEAEVRQAEAIAGLVRAGSDALRRGASLSPGLDAFRRTLGRRRRSIAALRSTGRLQVRGGQAGQWEVAARFLSASFVHMTNNRFGVTVPEEAFLAYSLARALGTGEDS